MPHPSAVPRSRPLHGVFVGTHAVAEGVVTARQLKSGLYRRLVRNVYADPGLPPDHQLFARGVALVMPADAALGGRSAAWWYGAPFAAAADPVLVVAPYGSAWRGPGGVRVHRAELDPAQVGEVDGVRLTTPQRTAWDVATLEKVPTAVAMLDGMVRAGHLRPEDLHRLLMDGRGRWRAARAAAVLPLVDGRSESPPESWVRVACARAGLPLPTPQFVVEQAGGFVARVDLAWPEQRVIVEYEGAYHFEGLQIVRDDRRYAQLTAMGWHVIRLSSADLRDMDAVVARIREALLRAG
jgi:hypothetical protein